MNHAAAASFLAASPACLGPRRCVSKRATSPLKNRVRGFSAHPWGRMPSCHRSRPTTATGYRVRRYEIASGRAEWQSRDPIGERGGINLYGYVSNNPVNAVDPLGLEIFFIGEVPPVVRPAIQPDLLDEAIRLNAPRSRVNLPDGRKVDLKGDPHFDKGSGQDIECPHTHDPLPNNPPPYDHIAPGKNPIPRPSTPKDIIDSINHLLNNINNFFFGPSSGPAPDPRVTA